MSNSQHYLLKLYLIKWKISSFFNLFICYNSYEFLWSRNARVALQKNRNWKKSIC